MGRYIEVEEITKSKELASKIVSFDLVPYIKVDDLLEFIDNLKNGIDMELVAGTVLELLDEYDIVVWKDINHIGLADKWVQIVEESCDNGLSYLEREEKRKRDLTKYLEMAGKL